MMMTTTATGKKITYELLAQKNSNIEEQHYCSSDIQVSKHSSILHTEKIDNDLYGIEYF